MFGQNTTLAASNNHKEGYQEGIDDVFIAFSDLMEKAEHQAQRDYLLGVYTTLSNQFPRPDESYEE